MSNQKHINTCLCVYSYSAGTQIGNRHQLPVTTSMLTYFILRAHTGTVVSHRQCRKNSGELLGTNAGEWTGRVETSEEEIPSSRRSMHGY